MRKIDYIELENFRVFKERICFDLEPITLIGGPNNSGKSSLIKAMLLLRENMQKEFPFSQLEFFSGSHNLGAFQNVINHSSESNEISFGVPISIPDFSEKTILDAHSPKFERQDIYITGKSFPYNPWKLDLVYSASKNGQLGKLRSLKIFNPKEKTTLLKLETEDFEYYEINFNFDLIYSYLSKADRILYRELPIDIKSHVFEYQKPVPKKMKKKVLELEHLCMKEAVSNVVRVHNQSKGNFELTFGQNFFNSVVDVITEIFYEEEVEFGLEDEFVIQGFNPLYYFYTSYIYHLLQKAFQQLNELSITHMSPIRGGGDRVYGKHSAFPVLREVLEDLSQKVFEKDHFVNTQGSYEPFSIGGVDLSEYIKMKFDDPSIEEKRIQFMGKWLKKFDVGEGIGIFMAEGSVYIPYLVKNGKKVLLADLGYGMAQLVPILIRIALHEEGLFIIEEPEANLHPRFQSLLADLFVDAYKTFGIWFVLESHSHFMIQKLQYLVAKKEIEPSKIAYYYLNAPGSIEEGAQQVERIKLLGDGSLLGAFLKEFYDSATQWELPILQMKGQN